MTDITNLVDGSQLSCLNSKGNPDKSTLSVVSSADEQLLLFLPFQQSVKIQSLHFRGNLKTVKVYVNKYLGFDDIESEVPTQEFVLDAAKVRAPEGQVVSLNFVRFQKVSSLTLFIEDNHDGSTTTVLQRLIVRGMPGETTRMQDLKKVEGPSGE